MAMCDVNGGFKWGDRMKAEGDALFITGGQLYNVYELFEQLQMLLSISFISRALEETSGFQAT